MHSTYNEPRQYSDSWSKGVSNVSQSAMTFCDYVTSVNFPLSILFDRNGLIKQKMFVL